MSDQYPGAGGLAGDEAAEPRVRGPLGATGETLEDAETSPVQDRVAESGNLDEDDGGSETLPPSPDPV